jgi:acetolactate synthase-1/2/3 large subunit
MRIAVEGRPGPVHVDLPYDVMLTECGTDAVAAEAAGRLFFAQASAGSDGMQALAQAIESASRPALVAGLQISRRGAEAERAFVDLAEKLGVPAFASLAAKGTLPEQHPLAAGTFRGVASERALLQQADLLVLIGFDPVEIFTPGIWLYDAPVVTLDEVAYTEGPYRPAVEVVANLRDALPALTSLVSPHGGWDREAVDAYKTNLRQPTRRRDGLQPATVIQTARRLLPDDGILTVDAGQHKVLTSDLWETRRPRGFFSSSGLGTMAVSIPQAIAAKLVEPQAPVLCFVGDGGFIMRAGDLETATREQLPIVIVVFNDRTLNLIKLQQDRRGFKRLGTSFGQSDFAAVARGFGFEAVRVGDEAALEAALSQAIASGRPWLIDATVDPEGYV